MIGFHTDSGILRLMTKKPKTLEITSSRSFASLLSGRYRSKIH